MEKKMKWKMEEKREKGRVERDERDKKRERIYV